MKKNVGFTYGQLEQMKELAQQPIATTSSQNIAKPLVVGSLKWSNISDNKNVIKLLKQRERIEAQIRLIDETALVKYELEVLQLS